MLHRLLSEWKSAFHRNDYVISIAKPSWEQHVLRQCRRAFSRSAHASPTGTMKFMHVEHPRIIYFSSLKFQIDI